MNAVSCTLVIERVAMVALGLANSSCTMMFGLGNAISDKGIWDKEKLTHLRVNAN